MTWVPLGLGALFMILTNYQQYYDFEQDDVSGSQEEAKASKHFAFPTRYWEFVYKSSGLAERLDF